MRKWEWDLGFVSMPAELGIKKAPNPNAQSFVFGLRSERRKVVTDEKTKSQSLD